MKMISAHDFMQLFTAQPNLQIIDVRTPMEWRMGHLEGTVVNVPLDRVSAETVAVAVRNPAEPLYILCRTQARAMQAASILQRQGLDNLMVVEGGMSAIEGLKNKPGETGFWGRLLKSIFRT